ncbi:MAG: hypothetical protein ACRDZX_03365 [Acidimicrobiales bacterium]
MHPVDAHPAARIAGRTEGTVQLPLTSVKSAALPVSMYPDQFVDTSGTWVSGTCVSGAWEERDAGSRAASRGRERGHAAGSGLAPEKGSAPSRGRSERAKAGPTGGTCRAAGEAEVAGAEAEVAEALAERGPSGPPAARRLVAASDAMAATVARAARRCGGGVIRGLPGSPWEGRQPPARVMGSTFRRVGCVAGTSTSGLLAQRN